MQLVGRLEAAGLLKLGGGFLGLLEAKSEFCRERMVSGDLGGGVFQVLQCLRILRVGGAL
jgi:hypothetical protein